MPGWRACSGRLLRAGYASFAAETFRYGVLYGSLGAIPLFLLWLYLSWFIVLAGARLAYALQNARFQSVWPALVGHPRGRELAAVRVVQHLTRSWVEQGRAPDRASLSREIELPEDVVQPILEALRDADLVHEGRHSGWSPARDPAQLTLGHVTAALGGHGLGPPDGLDPSLPAPDLAKIDAVLLAADAEASAAAASPGAGWTSPSSSAGRSHQNPEALPQLVAGRRLHGARDSASVQNHWRVRRPAKGASRRC